jgi:hypothetical protein
MQSVPASASEPIADIVIRESKPDLLVGYSPERMVEQCREKAAKLGAVVGNVVVEVGKRDEFDCPGLIATIDRAQDGLIDYIISWDMARLSGDLAKHLWVKTELKDTRCQIQYVTVEFADTDEGRLFETIIGAFNGFERMKTRARTQNGIRGKLELSRPICNGPTPYGLETVKNERGKPIGWVPSEQTFGVLKRIIGELPTRTLTAICTDLNAEGIPTPSGKAQWAPATIRALIGNRTYVGDYQFGKTKRTVGRDAHGKRVYLTEPHAPSHVTAFAVPAVLSEAEIERARAGLAARRKGVRPARRPEADDPYTLRGHLRCGYCGGVLSSAVTRGYRRYLCLRRSARHAVDGVRCPMPAVPAEPIEAYLWEAFLHAIADRDGLDAAVEQARDGGEEAKRHARAIETTTSEIARLARRIKNAQDVMLDFGRGSEQYEDAKEKSTAATVRKRTLEDGLAALERQRPWVMTADEEAQVTAIWDELVAGLNAASESAEKQRTLYRLLKAQAVVGLAADGEAGVRLARAHRFRVGWERLELAERSDRGQDPQGFFLQWHTQPSASDRLSLGLSLRPAS